MTTIQCKVIDVFNLCHGHLFNAIFLLRFLLGHGTSSAKYRPEFLDHFDQKEKEKSSSTQPSEVANAQNQTPDINSPAGQALQKQFQQIAGGQPVLQNVAVSAASNNTNNPSRFQQCIAEGDLDFVSCIIALKLLGNN